MWVCVSVVIVVSFVYAITLKALRKVAMCQRYDFFFHFYFYLSKWTFDFCIKMVWNVVEPTNKEKNDRFIHFDGRNKMCDECSSQADMKSTIERVWGGEVLLLLYMSLLLTAFVRDLLFAVVQIRPLSINDKHFNCDSLVFERLTN